jgi:formylglycine-generating enzyme required for sulfatase activity
MRVTLPAPSVQPSRPVRVGTTILLLVILLGIAGGGTADGAAIQGLAHQAAAKAGAAVPARGEFDDCAAAGWCPRMVALRAGSFVMGSPPRERGRFDDETRKQVRVAAFAIAKYPVTRGQWATFVAATGRPTPDAPCAYARALHPPGRTRGSPRTTRTRRSA